MAVAYLNEKNTPNRSNNCLLKRVIFLRNTMVINLHKNVTSKIVKTDEVLKSDSGK